jgi:beta-lactamase superfamily II metal-dependent hydrolase
MYCHGLGDCFLLTFSGGQHVLIDCGVLTPDFSRLRAAVADIEKETRGTIQLLVVTNRHWDHVSGFTQARGIFDRIAFGELWLSWTENPADAEAAQRRARYDALRDTLRLAAGQPGNPVAEETEELLAFFGDTREAMDYLAARRNNPSTLGRYCSPGETFELAGARFHVLGPPRGRLLRKPSDLALASSADPNSFHVWGYPFDPGFQTEPDKRYTAEAEAWRRIDDDWLAGSANLALQLDSDTNNASLALAIELETGDVLLFPGDAQAANWRSWHQVRWEKPDVTTANLLARTVFYKAGHHGSNHGTLREGGLDRMTSLRHVMIPAGDSKNNWQMPAPALYAALDEKTGHGVDRSDAAGDDLFIDWYV